MRRGAWLVPALLVLLAFGLRAWELSSPPFLVLDEPGNVPAAAHYWEDGQFQPDVWEHPPLRHLTLYPFLRVLGDNPWGWRLRNAILGSLAAALTWLLALEVTGRRRVGLLAGLLVATDPLHVVLSRHTYEEIYGGAFFLAAVLLFAAGRRRSAWLAASALLMGCALATKWYYLAGWALVGALALLEDDTWRSPRSALLVAATWALLPVSVYLLAYGPWFGRGYGLPELLDHAVASYRSLRSLDPASFEGASALLAHASAREWFVAPLAVGQGTYLPSGHGEFLLFVNVLPIWGLTLPALLAMAVAAWRRRDPRLALPGLVFLACYLPLALLERPVFLYSAAPLLPFAFIGIAAAVTHATDRLDRRLYWALLVAAVAWNGFLYPLVTARQVPVAPYRFVLDDPGVRAD